MINIIVLEQNEVISESHLEEHGTLSVGRAPGCDIVLAHPGVSSLHAEFSYHFAPFVEDKGSTNGTFVNGKRVSRTLLMSRDRVSIGPFTLQVSNRPLASTAEPDKTMIFQTPHVETPEPGILMLSGELRGSVLDLKDPFATLGQPGQHAALVMRKANGYSVSNIRSSNPNAGELATVNGEYIPEAGRMLYDQDLLIVGGVTMKFFADIREVKTGSGMVGSSFG
ncbi:MAG: FHA domain-containing protein [Gammaproteobacteria bacterium]